MGFTLAHELAEVLKYYGGDKLKKETAGSMKEYLNTFLNPERFFDEAPKAQEILDKVNNKKNKNEIILLISEEMFKLEGMVVD